MIRCHAPMTYISTVPKLAEPATFWCFCVCWMPDFSIYLQGAKRCNKLISITKTCLWSIDMRLQELRNTKFNLTVDDEFRQLALLYCAAEKVIRFSYAYCICYDERLISWSQKWGRFSGLLQFLGLLWISNIETLCLRYHYVSWETYSPSFGSPF